MSLKNVYFDAEDFDEFTIMVLENYTSQWKEITQVIFATELMGGQVENQKVQKRIFEKKLGKKWYVYIKR